MRASPLSIALAAGAACLLLAFAPVAWRMLQAPSGGDLPPAAANLPWQVQLPRPGQSHVMGLDLPGSTLAQALQRWPAGALQLALITPAAAAGTPSLEGYVERFTAGALQGRLLLSFAPPPDAAALSAAATVPRSPTASGGWRQALDPAVAAATLGPAALTGLGLIPDARLDGTLLQQRFGPAAERLDTADGLSHWLYPAQGLAVTLNPGGKTLLQYVAPADFEARLAAPLRRAPGVAAAAPR